MQFYEAFEFAEANNITLVGGSDATVGFAGGFLQGGGHGVLSPALGLAVDRAVRKISFLHKHLMRISSPVLTR